MYDATHGAWCNTRTWPAKCPTCKGPVFYFTCNCGCKVFFDELGQPWPIHDCDTSWTRKLKRTTDTSGKITVEIRDGVTVSRVPDSFGIDKNIIDQFRRVKKTGAPDAFVAIEPTGESARSIVGVLREIYRDVCPFKKYKFKENAMSRAMLGLLGEQKMGRVTIHVPQIAKTQADSFTLWIPSDLIKDSRITCGLTVSLTLESCSVQGHGYVWFSNEFEVAGS